MRIHTHNKWVFLGSMPALLANKHSLWSFFKIVCQLCWHAKLYKLVAVNHIHSH